MPQRGREVAAWQRCWLEGGGLSRFSAAVAWAIARRTEVLAWGSSGRHESGSRTGRGSGTAAHRYAAGLVSALFVLLAQGGFSQEVANAEEAPGSQPLRLNASVQQELSRLQDQWLLWNSSFLQGDLEQANAARDDLLRTAGELGFDRLPDLSAVALQRAVEAARTDRPERARLALDSAAAFDPGDFAWHFAHSRVQRAAGGYPTAAFAAARGYIGLLLDADQWPVVWRNLLSFLMACLKVASVLFVALLMGVKGPSLLRDLSAATDALFPPLLAGLLGVVFLLWPAFLPGGWLWLTLLWCVLLWGYCSGSERSVLALAVISVVALPSVGHFAQSRLEPQLVDGFSVVEDIEARALRGDFFQRLSELQRILPRSAAVRHLAADIHLSLGQDDVARPLYSAVVREEPRNGPALNNLGLFHFVRSDWVPAIEFFQKAADESGSAAAGSYNLAATYDELLEFRSATRAREAGRRASAEFGEWIDADRPWVAVWGGLLRGDEIRSELVAESSPAAVSPKTLLRPFVVAVFVILLGPLVRWLRSGRIGMRRVVSTGRELWIERLSRRAVPGVVAADAGDGWRAWAALFVPVCLLLVPLSSRLELLTVSAAQEPVKLLLDGLAMLGLMAYFAFVWLRRPV